MQERNEGLLERLGRWLGLGGEPVLPDDEAGVTWMMLPPYDIPGMAVVSGLLVENQGEGDAEQVLIQLHYPGERFITHMEVVSDDPYELEGGTPRDSRVTLRLPCLRAGKRMVVYVAGHNPAVPEVVVAVQAAP